MTIQYPISMASILAELQTANPSRGYPISLNDSDVRQLAGKPSGTISFSDLNGKSAATPLSATGLDDNRIIDSTGSSGNAFCIPVVYPSGGVAPYTYQWTITSSQNNPILTNATLQSARVSHFVSANSSGYMQAFLNCVVSDSAGHQVTVTGVFVSLTWESNA